MWATLLALVLGGVVLFAFRDENPKTQYFKHQGFVFGTYYNIRYSSTESREEAILKRLDEFDKSLSTFNPHSTISVLNQGRDTVWDADFTEMYQCAQEINRLSHGAFDITVAPLVNAWGFGFTNRETVTPELIDSLRRVKNVLDASAIAKGQACDVVAQLLKENGSENYLVDIGGEVVLHGVNDQGEPWRVGITKPVDDPTGENSEIQEVIASTHLCMATSGNYRQFYYENGLRRSHTIDPRTGYPVNHNLLSATVIAPSCMRADALATACMVLGVDSAMMLVESLPETECYLIYSPSETDTLAVIHTVGFPL
ncbi:MAG: FAD:protein FMN transferase [Paludibacteraceae bacterium]|nr:FAD:protein FMN transferase [Paludibacteraceae bacterium]MBR4547084.1 FAD:protein FMN transferase [Paludibacteraceae bacterium]